MRPHFGGNGKNASPPIYDAKVWSRDRLLWDSVPPQLAALLASLTVTACCMSRLGCSVGRDGLLRLLRPLPPLDHARGEQYDSDHNEHGQSDNSDDEDRHGTPLLMQESTS